jgi:hypothetical protein
MTMLKDSWDGRLLKVGAFTMASFVLAAMLSLAGGHPAAQGSGGTVAGPVAALVSPGR